MISRLTQAERAALEELAGEITPGREVVGVCAYGSKVAGYSRPDSDYDIIVAVKNFRQGVKYTYVRKPVTASALIVDAKGMIDDAVKASMGEFVVGRFLNVYEAISNEELFRSAELEYKKRVMLEALLEVSSDYGEFSQDLLIPFDYFLFRKLHTRAMIYPPALYSYVKTYTCASSAENREFSVRGFREASVSLEGQGLVVRRDDVVGIVREKMKGRAFNKLLSILHLTTRGVAQYAVHGYAGRVGLRVIAGEASSKVKRMKEKLEAPPELENPKTLLRLEEGRVFTSAGEMMEALAKDAGLAAYKHAESALGDVYSTRKLLKLEGAGAVSYVVKHFSDIRSVKWALLGAWASSRGFSMMPQARLHREYFASRRLREKGVMTPRVVGVVIGDKTLVTEYVSGKVLSEEVEANLRERSSSTGGVAAYGGTLARIHRLGFALGDSKAENVVIRGSEVYVTDLEQAQEGGDAPWDIAEFLYFTAKLSRRLESIRRVSDAFLKGYAREGDEEVIEKAMHPRYFAPFRPFVAPHIAKAITESMAAYAD